MFDWTITLGNVLSTIAILVAFVGGAWKYVHNHFQHMEIGLRADVSVLKSCVEKRFDKMETTAMLVKQDLIMQQEQVRMDFLHAHERSREDLAQHAASEQQFFGERMSGMERDIREIRERLFKA